MTKEEALKWLDQPGMPFHAEAAILAREALRESLKAKEPKPAPITLEQQIEFCEAFGSDDPGVYSNFFSTHGCAHGVTASALAAAHSLRVLKERIVPRLVRHGNVHDSPMSPMEARSILAELEGGT